MDTSTQNEGDTGGDDKDVRQIIDQLKSQGLFDQFRKDLLSDVDTKPAYQNLNQRVEGYVNRFLSRQIWSPRLNKNQLRDNLRRQINQSGMLINGVERVINQVVDPKILQVIKPKIDEVVCSYFGIDLKERQRQLEAHKQQQKQKLQSLMNLNVAPPGNVQDKTDQQSDPSLMKTNTNFPPGFPPDVWQQQVQQQSLLGFPGGMMNFPMATPFPQQMGFGMSPQGFPNMQNSWNNFMFPPMSGQMTSVPMGTSTTNSVTTSVTVTTSAIGSTTPTMSTSAADEVSPPKPDLPPLPPTPPPPGTEGEVEEDIIKPKVLDDIPLPPTVPKGELVEEEEVPSLDEIPLPPPSDNVEGEDTASKRPYKFAWEDDEIDKHSDITVSSVHTSDLSEFEDDLTTESELEYSDLTDHGNDDEEDWEEEGKKEDKDNVQRANYEKIVAESDIPENKPDEDNDDKPPVLEAVLETVPPVLEPEPVVTMVTEEKGNSQETDELPPEIASESETFVVEAEVTTMGDDGDFNALKNDAAAPPVLKSIEEIQSEEAKVEAPTLESVSLVGEGGNEVVEEEQITFEAIVQNIQTDNVHTEQGVPECAVMEATTAEGNMSQSAISARMAELEASIQGTLSHDASPPKKKLVSLQYNYSDSDDEETREERRARIAKEKEERYQKRQQRRAELEAKRKERDQEKHRLREERKKAKEKAAHENKEDSGDKKEENEASQQDSSHKESADNSMSSPTKKVPESPDKRLKQPRSPEKKNRKSKAELKEERVKQKVMEKKAALRRQRTRNRRYTSEEFTSIFNEKQQPYTSQSYSELVMEEQVVEETVSTTDYSMEVTVDYPGVEVEHTVEDMYSQMPGTPTQDEAPEPVSENLSAMENVNRGLRTRVRGIDDNQDVDDVRWEDAKKGNKRKRTDSDTKNEDDSRTVDSDSKSKQAKIEDDKSQKSKKRYDASDLYKPRPSITRGTRRRGSSPNSSSDTLNVPTQPKLPRQRARGPKPKLELPPEDEIIEITSRSPTPQPRSKSYSRSRSRSHSRSRSYSASRSRSRSHSHSHSRSRSSHKKRKRRKRKKKVKKRSRSRSGSAPSHTRDGASPISSSSLSISESSRSRHSSRSSRSGSRSSRSKTKSRSRSRSSESSVDEFGRRKRKGSLPLDYVDFGEAAKMARRSLVGVDFGEAERRSKQERGMPITTPTVGGEGKIPFQKTAVPGMFGLPVPGPAENPYNVNQRRPFRKRGGFQQTRGGGRGVPKTNALRKNWFQGGWNYQDGSSTGQTSGSDAGMRNSPPMSPSRRYYSSDMPRIDDDLESLSPESDGDLSPHEQQRRYRAMSQSSPPPYGPRGRLSPVSMYPYDDPEMSPTHMRGQSPIYMRDRSPSPLSPHHIPGRRPMSPLSPRMRVRRSPSDSPPPPHVRMRRSDSPPSPPYVRGRRSLSPVSPTHMRGRRSISISPPPRSQSPFSPPHLRGHRSPSPIPRGATRGMMPPSPTAYSHRRRGISPPHPAMRGHRSPSPEEYPMYRSPSPMHRPITRGYHSPAHSLSPPRMSKSPSPPHRPITRGYSPTRSPSPPSRPVTRGKRASSPLAKGGKKSQQVPLSPPAVGMLSRLRAKHTAPDRYSPTPTQKGRQRPPSPPATQGKPEKKKR